MPLPHHLVSVFINNNSITVAALLSRPRSAQVIRADGAFSRQLLPSPDLDPVVHPSATGVVLVDVIDIAALPADTSMVLRLLLPLRREAARIPNVSPRGGRLTSDEHACHQAWRVLASNAVAMEAIDHGPQPDLGVYAAEIDAVETRRMDFRRNFVLFMDGLVAGSMQHHDELGDAPAWMGDPPRAKRPPLFVVAIEIERDENLLLLPAEDGRWGPELQRALRMLGHERLVFVLCTR